MFDLHSPVSQKTFVAVLPIGYTPNEKVPYPVEWRLDLFDAPNPERGAAARYYADKIQPGETAESVLQRVMQIEFHATAWKPLSIVEEGNVPDNKGNSTPRIRVEVQMNPSETAGKKVNGLWPVWQPNNRSLYQHEVDVIAHWHATFLSTSKQIFGKDFNGSVASLAEVDRIITDSWGANPPQAMQPVVSSFGAYVGEILIKETGGRWVMSDGVFMVQIPGKADEKIHANVFAKTWKRFVNGEEDSLAYYVSSTVAMIKHGIPL